MFGRLSSSIFFALSWCAVLLTEDVTILIIIGKKVNGFPGLLWSSWKRRRPTHSEYRCEASNNNLPVYLHSPDSDFFALFPPKKSSSSSSPSNSPPPPKPAPEWGCLVGAGVPFSMLPTESESFPEINRLFSDERINRGLMSVIIQTAKYYNISFYITRLYLEKPKCHLPVSSFQACQILGEKNKWF